MIHIIHVSAMHTFVSHLTLYSLPIYSLPCSLLDFPGSSVVKNLPNNTGDSSSIPGSGRSLGEGNGNPLQCSCLGNPMDREWSLVC